MEEPGEHLDYKGAEATAEVHTQEAGDKAAAARAVGGVKPDPVRKKRTTPVYLPDREGPECGKEAWEKLRSSYREASKRYNLAGLEVEFQNVHFAYVAGFPILNGVNIRIEAGQKVAFVGPSGGGKSTLLKMLTREFDVSAGRVVVDGFDVRDLK